MSTIPSTDSHPIYFFTHTKFLSESWSCCLCNDKHSNSLLARITCCYYTFRYNPSRKLNIKGEELIIPHELVSGGTVIPFSCFKECLEKNFPVCPVCSTLEDVRNIRNAEIITLEASYLPELHR